MGISSKYKTREIFKKIATVKSNKPQDIKIKYNTDSEKNAIQ